MLILPVSAFDQVTRSGTWVVEVVVVVVVAFVAFNFGCDVVVVALGTYDVVVVMMIGFFFWGGVGLVPDDVIIVDCAKDVSFDGVAWVPAEIPKNLI